MSKKYIGLKSRIITQDVDELIGRYQTGSHIKKLMQNMLELVSKDDFLLLNEALIEKLQRIAMILSFKMLKEEESKELRRNVLKELHRQKNLPELEKEKKIQKMIMQERYLRKIPENYTIGKEEVLEMYSQDFDNFLTICYHYFTKEKVTLFYFLATIQKLLKINPEIIYSNKDYIRYAIVVLRRQVMMTDELEMYKVNTEQLIEKNPHIIDFSGYQYQKRK